MMESILKIINLIKSTNYQFNKFLSAGAGIPYSVR